MACTDPQGEGMGAHHGVLIWTFADLIQPECILDAPVEVGTFEINPGMPHIVAGGCSTGQIILWDTSAHDVWLFTDIRHSTHRNCIMCIRFGERRSPSCMSHNVRLCCMAGAHSSDTGREAFGDRGPEISTSNCSSAPVLRGPLSQGPGTGAAMASGDQHHKGRGMPTHSKR